MGLLPAPESGITTKTPESAKLQKRIPKKAVSGFYEMAAQIHQKEQTKRNFWQKIGGSIVEPWAVHLRALRLSNAAKKYGGEGQEKEYILSSVDFAKKLMKGQLTDAEQKQFLQTTEAHNVLRVYEVPQGEAANKAKRVVQTIFNEKGNFTDEQIKQLVEQSGMEATDIRQLITFAKENASSVVTPEAFMNGVSDDVLFNGLTDRQRELTKKVRNHAVTAAAFATAKYGLIAALAIPTFGASIGALGTAGTVGTALANAGLGGLQRGFTLAKEAAVYDIRKTRGLQEDKINQGWLGRVMGVDYDAEHRGLQIVRAAGAGALLSLAVKFHPQIFDFLGHAKDAIGAGTTAGGAGVHEAAKNVVEQQTRFPVNEHLSHWEQNTQQNYLPDTTHHDWQQLHSFAQQVKAPNGQTFNEIRVSYNGVDDGVAHGQHYIDMMMPDGKQVFVQNDAILAVNGPDADKLITIYGWNSQLHEAVPIGQMHSINLASELGLNQARIDNFANLSQQAHQTLWHGTQDASDLQTILANRGLYNNGGNGNYLWAVRMGGGHFDSNGTFQIGASNHYYDNSLLSDNPIKEYPLVPPVVKVPVEKYHSAIGSGLTLIDRLEDWGLDRVDQYALWAQGFLPESLRGNMAADYAVIAGSYVPYGLIGYAYGKWRKEGNPGPNTFTKYAARGLLGAGAVALFPAAAAAIVGRAIAGRKKRGGIVQPTDSSQINKPKTAPNEQPTPDQGREQAPLPADVPIAESDQNGGVTPPPASTAGTVNSQLSPASGAVAPGQVGSPVEVSPPFTDFARTALKDGEINPQAAQQQFQQFNSELRDALHAALPNRWIRFMKKWNLPVEFQSRYKLRRGAISTQLRRGKLNTEDLFADAVIGSNDALQKDSIGSLQDLFSSEVHEKQGSKRQQDLHNVRVALTKEFLRSQLGDNNFPKDIDLDAVFSALEMGTRQKIEELLGVQNISELLKAFRQFKDQQFLITYGENKDIQFEKPTLLTNAQKEEEKKRVLAALRGELQGEPISGAAPEPLDFPSLSPAPVTPILTNEPVNPPRVQEVAAPVVIEDRAAPTRGFSPDSFATMDESYGGSSSGRAIPGDPLTAGSPTMFGSLPSVDAPNSDLEKEEDKAEK